jgi:transposase
LLPYSGHSRAAGSVRKALRGGVLGWKAWLSCGLDRGGEGAAAVYTRIGTAKLNEVDPYAQLADSLERVAQHPVRRLHELRPWRWAGEALSLAA